MLQISFIRQNIDLVKERLSARYFSEISIVDKVVELDEQVRKLKVETETLQAEMNVASKEIGALMGKGQKELADEKKQLVALDKSKIQILNELLGNAEKLLQDEIA
jgi:seryl-tRNA synthetase